MEISDDLLCLYSAEIEEDSDRSIIEIPEEEIAVGNVEPNQVYRVALLPTDSSVGEQESSDRSQKEEEPTPPVEKGEKRTVDIEDIGEKGDGIARVERGYVVIVPDTEQGERITVEIRDVRENLAFAEIVEREEYFE